MNALPANPFDLMTAGAANAPAGAFGAGARGQVKAQAGGQAAGQAEGADGANTDFAQFLLQVQEQQAAAGPAQAARPPAAAKALAANTGKDAGGTDDAGENITAVLARLLGGETADAARAAKAAAAAGTAGSAGTAGTAAGAAIPADGGEQAQGGDAAGKAPPHPHTPGQLVAAAVHAALAEAKLAERSAATDDKAAAQPAKVPENSETALILAAAAGNSQTGATAAQAEATVPALNAAQGNSAPPLPGIDAARGGDHGASPAAPVPDGETDSAPAQKAKSGTAGDKPSASAPPSQDARAAAQAHLPPLPALAAARAQQMARPSADIQPAPAPGTDGKTATSAASAASGNGESSAAAALRAGMAAASQRTASAADHAPAGQATQLAAPGAGTHLENQAAADGDALPVPLTGQVGAEGAKTAQMAQTASAYSAAATVPVAHLAFQIASQARKGLSRFEIRMDPPELGRVDVRLDMAHDGSVTTRMIVERAETLDLLQRDARALERALGDAGFSTGDGSLQFSLKGEGFAGHQQQDGAPGRQGAAAAALNGAAIEPQAAQATYPRNWVSDRALDIRV